MFVRPEKFDFDLTGLEIGDSIHFSDTNVEESVKPTITDRDFTIASIRAPSALTSAESESETEEDDDPDAETETDETSEDQKEETNEDKKEDSKEEK